MKNLGIPYAVGYIIAGLVLLPLLIFTVNKFFFQGNEVEKHLNLYLGNSEEINMHISPEQEIKMDYERYTAFLAKKHGGIIHIRVNTFYSPSQKKYFQFRMANISDNFYTAFYNHIKKLNFVVTVNKDDINNPNMGTKEHPIPVFKVVGDEKPIRIWHDDKNGKTIYENYDITQEQYEFSVYVHLKYVMSKEEFKERFEKSK